MHSVAWRSGPSNNCMQQTVGAIMTSSAPPAADAERSTHNGVSTERRRCLVTLERTARRRA
jgi:hypothetical protein